MEVRSTFSKESIKMGVGPQLPAYTCSKCKKRPAFYNRAYSGEYLCKKCFVKAIYKKTVETIKKYKLINYGERVGVGVSGGKDSLSLLFILSKFLGAERLVSITIDEGIAGYREEAVGFAETVSRRLGVKHVVYTYKQLFGRSMDEVQPLKGDHSSCSICGTFRRRALDIAAEEAGVDVLATAHNLDDLVQSFLIILTNGDLDRLAEANPAVGYSTAFSARKVHPFMAIYERELAIFAMLKRFPMQSVTCPYMNEGIRTEVRNFLNTLEEGHPGIKFELLRSYEGLVERRTFRNGGSCSRCGRPSKGSLCQVCMMMDALDEASRLHGG